MAAIPNTPKARNSAPTLDDGKFRFNLAMWVVIFAFGGIATLGTCAILMAAGPGLIYVVQKQGTIGDIKEGFTNVKDILGILLPVMSAWAGTVFAFYFTRENFESASRTTAALVQQLTSEEKLKSILAKDVMIKIEDADKLVLEKEPKEIKLKADIIEGILTPKNRERLPILDKDGHVKYMAHRSLLERFIATRSDDGKKTTNLTLADMLSDENYRKILEDSFCAIPETSSLGDAKKFMEAVQKCSDVFITNDGQKSSKAIGWITDVIVRQNATV